MYRSILNGPTLLILLVAGAGNVRGEDQESLGVLPASREAQREAETLARSVPSPEQARAWLKVLTEEPHVAGTTADHATAVFVREKLSEWGWDAKLVEYQVLLNDPVDPESPDSVVLEIVRPNPTRLPVREQPHPPDKDSVSPAAWPAFHGYGVSGDVTGQIVYANYGTPEDFDALNANGVDVAGKIALVRYGGLFRGLKVLNAQRAGAIGVLIYSDPADDGYLRGDVYPNGPFRPPSAIQRGSVQFLSKGPGDPTTPGRPSTGAAKRLPIDLRHGFPLEGGQILDPSGVPRPTTRDDVIAWEEQTGLDRREAFAAIPSLPISYEAARPILEGLGGENVPEGWQGGLPFAYHLGPGPIEVRFRVSMEYAIRPIWNVIATIPGRDEPDRWVLVGNHRDAWTYGAVDPGSGTAATLEMCRAIGEAVKAGWAPRRTLVYASWDAEEYGLVGSTEWAEEHAEELGKKAVLLLNVDSAVAGPNLDIDGVPSLRDLILDAAGDVVDPRNGKTLREGWTARRRKAWATGEAIDLDPAIWDDEKSDLDRLVNRDVAFSPRINDLGSGSDYTAFLDHLGIPAADVNLTGRYGVYHAVYDDFYWMEQFGDPGFHLHALAARLFTRIVLRAAGSDVLPFRFVPYGQALREHVDELQRMLIRKRRASDEPPKVLANRLPELIRAVRTFRKAAEELDEATTTLTAHDLPPDRLPPLNDALMRVERAFLVPEGLPGRPWFRHALYAPGLTLGYGAWPLPGLRQAVEDDDPAMFDAQLTIVVERIKEATERLRSARELALESIPE